MSEDMQNRAAAITNMLVAIEEKYAEYTPVHAEYVKTMSAGAGYEVVPDLDDSMTRRASITLDMLASGELTTKGRDRAIEAGLIRKIAAVKPEKLVNLEKELTGMINDYKAFTAQAVASFAFKSTGTRTVSAGTRGHIDEVITAELKAIDPGVTVNFEGRRVYGQTSTGASFDFDKFGQNQGVRTVVKFVQTHH